MPFESPGLDLEPLWFPNPHSCRSSRHIFCGYRKWLRTVRALLSYCEGREPVGSPVENCAAHIPAIHPAKGIAPDPATAPPPAVVVRLDTERRKGRGCARKN